jgi:hypothetical protein
VQPMNGAVDHVRRREHRQRRAQGDETLKVQVRVALPGRERARPAARALHRRRARKQLQTARAWALRESLRDRALPLTHDGRGAGADGTG